MVGYKLVKRTKAGKLVSFWARGRASVSYYPGKATRAKNGLPLFVFTKVDDPYYCYDPGKSEEVWLCEYEPHENQLPELILMEPRGIREVVEFWKCPGRARGSRNVMTPPRDTALAKSVTLIQRLYPQEDVQSS